MTKIADNYYRFADVAELADAQASEACGLMPVEVQLLSSALNLTPPSSFITSFSTKNRPI